MNSVLYLDIETVPNLGFFWNPGWRITLTYENILVHSHMVSVAWTWDDNKKIESVSCLGGEDDAPLAAAIANEIEKADVVVFHNGDKFDLKWIRTRLLYHGLEPFHEPRTRDTLKIARKFFRFPSNRLDDLGDFLGVGRKRKEEYELWKRVALGDKKALDEMVKYNKQDVVLLRKVYKELVVYGDAVGVHLGRALHDSEHACPQCGSLNTKKDGVRIAKKIKYQGRRCNDCGHPWRTGERYHPAV